MNCDSKVIKNIISNDFEIEDKYKLYRKMSDVIHPTISKKNISDYKIVLDDKIFPIRVFYPKKVTKIEKVIIFIHGNGYVTGYKNKYSDICMKISKNINSLMISIDYELDYKMNEKYFLKKLYDTTSLIIKQIKEQNLNNIILMSDSTSADLCIKLNELNNLDIKKQILITPIINFNCNNTINLSDKNNNIDNNLLIRLNQYNNFYNSKKQIKKISNNIKNQPNTLIITGNADPLKENGKYLAEKLGSNCVYKNINFANHNILLSTDKEINDEFNNSILNFINN